MSQVGSKFVSNRILGLIQLTARTAGYVQAIHQHLNILASDSFQLRERARWHVIHGPVSFSDPYLLERSWVMAVGDLLKIDFEFEIDVFVYRIRDLPKKPDNPT